MLEDFRLKVFLEVARRGSFTLAAKALDVTQPAVSQNITNLERQLGVRLFDRAKGECPLTPEGLAFKDYAERITYWYGAADAMFGEHGRMTAGRPVRIAADPVAASYLLPPAMATLLGAQRGIGFVLEPLDHEQKIAPSVFDPVSEPSPEVPGSHFGTPEDADVEVSVRPSPETMDFEGESRLVGVMDAAVVAAPHNRSVAYAAEAAVKPFSTLAGVHVSNRFAVWAPYMDMLTPDLVARVAVSAPSIEAVKTLVRHSGTLVGVVPAPAVRAELAAGTLVQLPVRLPEMAFDVHFNPLPEFAGKTVCQLFRQALKDSLSQ